MNELEELKQILDKDEEIKVSFKPNKKRFTTINILASSLFMFIIFLVFFLIGLFALIGTLKNAEGSPIWMLVVSGIILAVLISNIIGQIVRYKRIIYVITNKRIIIRSGFIGVDYKSLDLKNITMVNVRMDFLDKLVKPNTGTIQFGSAATPIVSSNNNNQTGNQFNFADVENPYEVYRICKELIDSSKDNDNNVK